MSTPPELEPIDYERCQTDIPTGQGPFTLGPVTTHIRCKNKPSHVLTEKVAGPDGLHGAMSVCHDCLDKFLATPQWRDKATLARVVPQRDITFNMEVCIYDEEEAQLAAQHYIDGMGLAGVSIVAVGPLYFTHR